MRHTAAMKLPNLLATSRGRLAAFFLLYVTEGIPLGFAATAVAAQLRRMGVGPAEIGAFVGAFYLPWAFKWAFGPFIDVIRSRRFGHRRAWIIFTQVMMALTLLALIPISLPQGLGMFTAILLVHNSFGAMQDVAIDALACNALREQERGLANGLMFAGASIGTAIGGSGVLYLMAYTGFQGSFVAVAVAILLITLLVALPMKESVIGALQNGRSEAAVALAPSPEAASTQTRHDVSDAAGAAAASGTPTWRNALLEMRSFAVESFRSFIGSQRAFRGVFVALLPAGAMSLGLALQTNLSVEFGMKDEDIANLSLATNVLGAGFMVLGGWLADRWGRLRMLALYLASMSLPVFYLAWQLQQAGYVMPRALGGAPMPAMITLLWVTSVAYAVGQGLMYGTRSAVFMDITNPRVAATQFTAYMAMMNLAIAYSSTWLGIAVEAWGYPATLWADGVIGLICILLLSGLKKRQVGEQAADGAGVSTGADMLAAGRARRCAWVLGLLCLLWLPAWHWRSAFGAAQPIVTGTFFTLVFVLAALFLLAGREVIGLQAPAWWRRVAPWSALALLLIYARRFLPATTDAGGGWAVAEALVYLVPLIAGVMLAWLSRQTWNALRIAK
jgi:MFS transporter, PAT family, beta-lactamase induction signal transducer AmpG